MSVRTVFVIGASGNVGKATVKALSANYGGTLDIRAGVRNPEKASRLDSLPSVTVVRAEMGKRDELTEIFQGVDVLFIVVPGAPDRVELTRITAEAARNARVKHILTIGAYGHLDLALNRQMRKIEDIISNLGPNYTILRLPWFMDNFFGFKDTIQKSSAIYDSIDPNRRFPTVCMDDLGLAAAVLMASAAERNTPEEYSIVSDRHTFHDIVKAFSDALGKKITYTHQSYEEAKTAWLQMGAVSEQQIDGLFEYWKAVNAGEYEEGNDSNFTAITGKHPTNIATWVQRHVNVFK